MIVALFLIKHGGKTEFLSIVPLIPLFALSMVPVALGNVLLNSLMAHSRFKVVPFLVAMAVGYWVALQHLPLQNSAATVNDGFKMVIETFGIFSTLYLVICVIFTWVVLKRRRLDCPRESHDRAHRQAGMQRQPTRAERFRRMAGKDEVESIGNPMYQYEPRLAAQPQICVNHSGQKIAIKGSGCAWRW